METKPEIHAIVRDGAGNILEQWFLDIDIAILAFELANTEILPNYQVDQFFRSSGRNNSFNFLLEKQTVYEKLEIRGENIKSPTSDKLWEKVFNLKSKFFIGEGSNRNGDNER
ncbi:MAG: hypothetical protein LBI13_01840 [Streptococcaceae bacterium]|jgi:hypothetical protein|nr:hypothetical protein [Streptococcaceae bacterium]